MTTLTWMPHNEFYARDRAAMAERDRREPGRRHTPFSDFDKLHGEPGHCKGTLVFEDPDAEHGVWMAGCDTCDFMVGVRRQDADPDWRANRLLERSGLPLAMLDKDFERDEGNDQAVKSLTLWLQAMTSRRPPLLHGSTGVGKTHLLTRAGARLCRANVPVVYRGTIDLLAAERDYIDRPEGARPLTRATDAEVLILDDLGAERLTPWAAEQLHRLIDERYKAGRPTLAATNLNPAEWAERFGDRTASRLAGMTEPVEVIGRDRRLTLSASP